MARITITAVGTQELCRRTDLGVMDPMPQPSGRIEPSERFKGFDPVVVESVLAALEMTLADLGALEQAARERSEHADADRERLAGEISRLESRKSELSGQIAILELRLADCQAEMQHVHSSLRAIITDDSGTSTNPI